MQLYAHVQPNIDQQEGISIARPNGLISKSASTRFCPCRTALYTRRRRAGPDKTAAGGRLPRSAAGREGLPRQLRGRLTARSAGRAAAKHHSIGWSSASLSKTSVFNRKSWCQLHQACTTLLTLPHDGLDHASTAYYGQFQG